MQELIRGILDLIDRHNAPEPETTAHVTIATAEPVDVVAEPTGQDSPLTHAGDEINRFKHIVDLADKPATAEYSNEPNEQYASIEAVTSDAGGGLNGPKHPADIRASTQAMYPGRVHGAQ